MGDTTVSRCRKDTGRTPTSAERRSLLRRNGRPRPHVRSGPRVPLGGELGVSPPPRRRLVCVSYGPAPPRGRPATPAKRRRAAAPAQPATTSPLPEAKRNLRFHDLRHTCASLLIANGASIMLVSQRLGHASARMTLDRYAHLYPSEEAAMAQALDAVWEADQPTHLDTRRGARAGRQKQ